jgi:Domain of unknown function (DUF4166)
VLGGYGVFGARVAAGLVADGETVIVAGRSLGAAQSHCAARGGTPMALDHGAPGFPDRLRAIAPFAVIDAAGPFQHYTGHATARAALDAGAHYLDLSDDAAFTAGITTLDAGAKAAGLTLLSGVSSVPALSSAAVTTLARGLTDIHDIDSTILPGNRAPRGLSVIRAILAQAGRPLTLWREGPSAAKGWSNATKIALHLPDQSLPPRPASLIGAPDLALFPAHFRARNVTFRAGLELGIMHHGLTLLSWPTRVGLLPAITALSRPLQWAANLLKPFGTDRGGMRVRVMGQGPDGPVTRTWTLIAGAGDGPHIPAIPARVMIAALRQGSVPPGARACLAAFPLAAAEAVMARYAITTGITETATPHLFRQALGPAFAMLPAPVQDLHAVMSHRRWQGRATVTRGRGIMARAVATIMRFPPAGTGIPLTVTMERRGDTECWTRNFNGRRFRSILRWNSRRLTERFGALTFTIALQVQDGKLHYPVTQGWFLCIPLPRWSLPRSDTHEAADGTYPTFDVALSLPVIGRIVRYQGWLAPACANPAEPLRDAPATVAAT